MLHRNRKNIRLPGYDYSRPGCYFITINVHKNKPLLGEVKNDQSILNKNGQIIQNCWASIPIIYSNVILDEFIIMPNHIHGLINIVGAGSSGPQDEAPKVTLPSIIARFKYSSTRELNSLYNSRGQKIWQRNYYEHVIRNEAELSKAREYIINNPLKWGTQSL